METNTAPKFKLVLVTKSWNGKMKVTVKASSDNEVYLKDEKARMFKHAEKCGHSPDYRVVGPIQYKRLLAEVKGVQDTRRKAGAVKAAKTRAKNVAKGAKPQFICCPTCGAKSKKLFSEMGGLQTRKCQRGHTFEYDKWLSDRAFWAPVLTGRVIPQDAITRPVDLRERELKYGPRPGQ
jgi:hypothetical protein